MCTGKKGCCCKPKQFKTSPEECSPKQIKECHGDVKQHPCARPAKKG